MSKRNKRMAVTEVPKATTDDRFEVLQQSIEEQSRRLAKVENELATANERIAALSVQVSQPVMGIKVEEPKTRQGTKNLTAEGWDTTAMVKRLAEEGRAN
jgi:predicted  nucleic acid-binding Zn-ribbon protein